MLHCPNKNLKAWKDLVSSVGENKAQLLWNEYEGNVPANFYSSHKKTELDKIKSILDSFPFNTIDPSQKEYILKEASKLISPLLLFKGMDGKTNLKGKKFSAHSIENTSWMSASLKDALTYARNTGEIFIFLVDNSNSETVKADGKTKVSDIEKVESELIRNSKAKVVHLDRLDSTTKEKHVVVKGDISNIASVTIGDKVVINTDYKPDGSINTSQEYKHKKELTPESDLDTRLKSLMEELGYKVEEVNEMIKVGSTGKTAFGLADNLNKLIQVVNNNMRGADVLPEEVAHIITRLIRNTPIYDQAMEAVERSKEYKEVLKTYKNVYSSDKDFKEEAIGKIIAKELLKQQGNSSWFNKVIRFLKKLFKGKSLGEPLDSNSVFKNLASDIDNLSRGKKTNYITLEELVNSNMSMSEYLGPLYAIQSNQQDFDDIDSTIQSVSNSVTKINGVYFRNGNVEIVNKGTDIDESVREAVLNKGYKTSYKKSKNRELAEKASKLLYDVLFEDNTNDVTKAMLEFRKRFKEEFFEYEDAVKDNVLNTINITSSDLYSVKASRDKIHSDLKAIDPLVKIYTNVVIADKNTASSVNTLAVFSDGSLGVYDSYSTNRNLGLDDSLSIDDINIFSSRMAWIKETLLKSYGASTVRLHRAIPISVSVLENYGQLAGIKNWNIGTYYNSDAFGLISPDVRENLKEIPLLKELTEDTKVNKLLTKLFEVQELLQKRINSNLRDKQYKDLAKTRLAIVTKAIQSIQLNETYADLHRLVEGIDKFLKAPGRNSIELRDTIEILESIKDVGVLLDPNKDSSIAFLNTNVNRLLYEARESLAFLLEGLHPDIYVTDPVTGKKDLKPVKQGDIFDQFNGLNDYQNPAFSAAADVISEAEIEKLEYLKDFTDKFVPIAKAFETEAKSRGFSGDKLFSPIMDSSGNLISIYNDKFKEDKKQASLNKDTAWFASTHYADTALYDRDLVNLKSYYEGIYGVGSLEVDARMKRFMDANSPYSIDGKVKMYSKYVKPKPYSEMPSKYINPKYEIVNSTKAFKDYYDFYVESNRQFIKWVGPDKLKSTRFVGNFYESTMDVLSNISSKGGSALLDSMLNQSKIREYDSLLGTSVDGVTVDTIPIIGLDPIKKELTEEEKLKIEKEALSKYKKDSIKYKAFIKKESEKLMIEKGKKERSNNLSTSLLLMAQTMINYKTMSEVEEKFIVLQEIVEEQENIHTDQFGENAIDKITSQALKSKMANSNAENFRKITKSIVYGQKIQGKDFKIFGRSGTKLLKEVSDYQTLQALGLDLTSAASNLFGAMANANIIGTEGKWFKSNEFNDSVKEIKTCKKGSKTDLILQNFRFKQRDFMEESLNDLKNTWMSKNLTSTKALSFMNWGDDMVDNALIISVMKNFVVDSDGILKSKGAKTTFNKIKDPNAKSVYDLITVDENGNLDVPLTKEQKVKLYRIIQKTSSKVKGTTSNISLGAGQTSAWMFALMKFRTWIPGMARSRFGDLKVEELTGDIDQGYFMVGISEILRDNIATASKELLALTADTITFGLYKRNVSREASQKALDKFLTQNPEFSEAYESGEFTLDDFMKMRNDKMRMLTKELRILFYSSLTLLALAGLGWEDEDDEYAAILKPLYTIAEKSQREMTFFLNPLTVSEFFSNPTTIMQVFKNTGKLVKNTAEETYEFVSGSENKRDKANIGHYTLKMIPGVNGLNKILGYAYSNMFRDFANLSGDGYVPKKSKKDSKGWLEELLED